jgi:hypothetical protein
VAADAGRMIRELRKMAIGLTDELKAELGPEIGDLDLASLHPKRLMEKALLERTATSPPRRRARVRRGGEIRPGAGRRRVGALRPGRDLTIARQAESTRPRRHHRRRPGQDPAGPAGPHDASLPS